MEFTAPEEQAALHGEQADSVEDHGEGAVGDIKHTLSKKGAESAELTRALDERLTLADAPKAEILVDTTSLEAPQERPVQNGDDAVVAGDHRGATVSDAERALSEKEAELAKLRSALDERTVATDLQKTEIVVLKVQIQTLQARLRKAGEDAKALQDRYESAERALSEKEKELVKLRSICDEGSMLAESHKAEIVALTGQVETLKKRLIRATEEARAEREQRDTANIELNSVTQRLNQLVQHTADERALGRRAQHDLESQLAEQSRVLSQSEFELHCLRSEAESAREAEADLRIAVIEIDGRAHAAAQDFKVEKARLQAALERANGERARLSYELAELKRRVEGGRAAERVEA
jgi:chromosome segregation ATPase